MPWDWSDAAAAALLSSHTAVSRVDVLHSGKPVYTLEVTDGNVNIDADRPVRRNLSCSLVDSTGTLTRGDVDDLLNPYECEIAPHRGVRVVGVDELAPQGVFGLTGRDVQDSPDGLSIRLTGQDRAMGYQGPMVSALAIDGGTAVENAIARLLAARNPGLSLLSLSTGFVTGPLVFAPDIDVWAEAQKLAESVGARLFHDRTGQCALALAGPGSDRPVTTYAEGGGLLLGLSRVEDSDTIKNVVVAETPDGAVRAVAEDDDPTSPTYARGRYGRRVASVVNQHFTSTAQALQAATVRLAYELGRSETVTFTAVPDPGRDVEEVVTVHRPRAGLEHRGVVIATLDVPLSASESMKVGCRQSRLAQDGRQVPAGDL
jgi:hypothetical protein